MDMEKTLPTRGQLERQISQGVQALYQLQFGHLPRKVTCHIFGDKVAIVAEDTVTAIEQILHDNSQADLAREIRSAVCEAFTVRVKQTVTEILDIEVVDVVGDSTLESGCLGAIVFLKGSPQIRLAKRERYQDKSLSLKLDRAISQ